VTQKLLETKAEQFAKLPSAKGELISKGFSGFFNSPKK
jgi:hypothetical protein